MNFMENERKSYFGQLSNLGLVMSMLFIKVEIYSVVAVSQMVLGYTTMPITDVSSLCCNPCYFNVSIIQINLQPLVFIICASRPAPCVVLCFFYMKSTIMSFFFVTPFGRGAHLTVGDGAAFHPSSLCTL